MSAAPKKEPHKEPGRGAEKNNRTLSGNVNWHVFYSVFGPCCAEAIGF